MAANDGLVPVRTLARAAADPGGAAARTIRRRGERTGAGLPQVARACPRGRPRRACTLGVARTDRFAGCVGARTSRPARFVDPHTIETTTGLRLQAENASFAREESAGGSTSPDSNSPARTATPGPDLGAGVDAGDRRRPRGAGRFGLRAFGSRVQLFHRGPRILPTEDDDVSAAVASAFRGGGPCRGELREIESFEKTPGGVRMNYRHDGVRNRRKRHSRSWPSAGRRTRPG